MKYLLTAIVVSNLFTTCRAAEPTPQTMADAALEPPILNTAPGPEFSDKVLNYAMVIGMDRTPKGRLWACWVAGGDNQEGLFVAATSDDDGKTWSHPRLVIDPTDPFGPIKRRTLVGNVWTDPTGRLWLFFDQSTGYFDGRAGDWCTVCENPDDESPRWSPPRRIWHGCTLNKLTVLKSGEWLLPISLWPRDRINPKVFDELFHDLDNLRMANVFVSADQGATWTRRGGAVFPMSAFDEHMIVELRDGKLWMLARTKSGFLGESFSSDVGRTWTDPQPSKIDHTSSRFHIRRLASGRLLLVKHGAVGSGVKDRSQLTAQLSDDDGQTWQGGLLLDERKKISYPDGFQAPDGAYYVIYDNNRSVDSEILMAKFREADVLAGKLQSPDARLKVRVHKALGPKPIAAK
jgi:predicted neuraminidase